MLALWDLKQHLCCLIEQSITAERNELNVYHQHNTVSLFSRPYHISQGSPLIKKISIQTLFSFSDKATHQL